MKPHPDETFLIIYRGFNAEFYRNGLPIARTVDGKTELHQFKDASGSPLPHTKEHLNDLWAMAVRVQCSADLLERAVKPQPVVPQPKGTRTVSDQ